MTDENKRHNIGLEVAEAEGRLMVAEQALRMSQTKTASALAYYYAFHYARALLLMDGLESKTHGGVVHLLNLHFVRTQRLSPELNKILGDLQHNRELAEYDAAAVFTEGMASDAIRDARLFAEKALQLLREGGFL